MVVQSELLKVCDFYDGFYEFLSKNVIISKSGPIFCSLVSNNNHVKMQVRFLPFWS